MFLNTLIITCASLLSRGLLGDEFSGIKNMPGWPQNVGLIKSLRLVNDDIGT